MITWIPKRKPKPKPKKELILCRIVPPLVALAPELLDTPVPRGYSPKQAIELLNLKIENLLLRSGL